LLEGFLAQPGFVVGLDTRQQLIRAELPKVGVISPGHYEQPPLAKILGTIGVFWLNHWKWIITTVVAVIGGIWLKTKQ
jgi:hypothetical protein